MTDSILNIAKRTDAFMMERSPIHEAMRRISTTLSQMDILFAVAGAMAANMHGHRCTTAVVDIVLSDADLKRFKDEWIGRGWLDKFEGSKGFRDTVCNVSIDVLLVGDYPGDGQPKPVRFPNPESVAEISDGIPFLSLASLIELKLASGMTAEHRLKDKADVIELIRVNRLAEDYQEKLDEYVRSTYLAMWRAAQVEEDY